MTYSCTIKIKIHIPAITTFMTKLKVNIQKLLGLFGPASARSYKIGVVGNWLVGNAVFSETALRIFLIFCMKLGDYKGRKVTAAFLKKVFDLEIFTQRSPN